MQPDAGGTPDSALRLLHVGRNRLQEGRWEDARTSFQAALAREELPEALEGLGWAAWWLDDAEAVFQARERAFLLYRERDRSTAAARMAIWLAVDHLDFHGASAVARGWLARARRLLEGADPGPELGWLAFHDGYLSYVAGDLDRAMEAALRSAEFGRSLGVPDLEMLGLGLRGSALVARGKVERGMALLDEATAIALCGEATLPISGAWTCCFLVSTCEGVRDYPRAFEWCRQIETFARRYGSRYMLGFCRTHYGVVFTMGGRWREAEAALEEAVEAYSRSRPGFLPEALIALAELRRRQGRRQGAERLLEKAGPGDGTLICRGHLALDRGEALRAVELAERFLRRLPRGRLLDRAPALELLVRARTFRNDLVGAGEALEQLRAVQRSIGTPLLAAAVEFAAGVLAAASHDHQAARRLFEDAGDRFRSCTAPFEAARVGIELSRTLAALGRRESAVREATAARDLLAGLGAEGEARRAEEVLAALRSGGGRADPLPALTPREREVLREVAGGLTNREVAGRLHISEHTVHRHVANILRKLNVPSRTAAASRAARAGLLVGSEP
jgi:LuxR family transcriptional regulator, maltose regulon positive regulatory protein